ncbi:hypothetical protein ACJQWK_02936 [Exserohilum turcicum]
MFQTIDQERTYIEVLVPNSEDESVTAETKKNRPQKQPSPGSIKNKERINTPKKRFKRQPCAGVTVNSGDRNATSEARTFKSRQKGDTSQDLAFMEGVCDGNSELIYHAIDGWERCNNDLAYWKKESIKRQIRLIRKCRDYVRLEEWKRKLKIENSKLENEKSELRREIRKCEEEIRNLKGKKIQAEERMIQAEEKLHEVEMSHAKLEKQNSEYKKKINRQQRGIVKLQRMYQEKDNELQKHGLTPSLLLQVNRLYEKLQLAHIQSDA